MLKASTKTQVLLKKKKQNKNRWAVQSQIDGSEKDRKLPLC